MFNCCRIYALVIFNNVPKFLELDKLFENTIVKSLPVCTI